MRLPMAEVRHLNTADERRLCGHAQVETRTSPKQSLNLLW